MIYAALAVTAIGIAAMSVFDAPDATQAWIEARQFYGLWALGLLLAAMMVGPLCFVLPWLPIKAHLVLGRRALGVSAFVLAVLHTISYLGPTIYRDWHGIFSPGTMWIVGLGHRPTDVCSDDGPGSDQPRSSGHAVGAATVEAVASHGLCHAPAAAAARDFFRRGFRRQSRAGYHARS